MGGFCVSCMTASGSTGGYVDAPAQVRPARLAAAPLACCIQLAGWPAKPTDWKPRDLVVSYHQLSSLVSSFQLLATTTNASKPRDHDTLYTINATQTANSNWKHRLTANNTNNNLRLHRYRTPTTTLGNHRLARFIVLGSISHLSIVVVVVVVITVTVAVLVNCNSQRHLQILKDFPEELRGDVSLHLHREVLSLPIFATAPQGFLKSLARHIESKFCCPT